MSEERREINHIVMPTRENYRRHKEQLREGKRKIEEIEKREQEFFRLFSVLFYGNANERNVRNVNDTFSDYTATELEEMYPKLQYLAPWKDDESRVKLAWESGTEILTFLMIYLTADFLLMTFLSFFVWKMFGNFLLVSYSVAISGGIMGIMLVVKGVINYVRKKKEE